MEYDAERGSEEIASCLYDWVQKMLADPKIRFNRLRVFMDNCAGRKYFFHCIIFNKLNIFIILYLLVIVLIRLIIFIIII